MTIPELITALENAKGPDRELDWRIADYFEEVPKHTIREIGFDYDWFRRPNEYALWKATDSEGRQVGLWQPKQVTGSLDAAVALAERVLPAMTWRVEKMGDAFDANIWDDPEDDAVAMVDGAVTPAIALLIATLKAKESEEAK